MNLTILLMSVATFVTAGFLVYGLSVYTGDRREMKERFTKPAPKASALTRRDLIRKEENKNSLKNRLFGWISSLGKIALGEDHQKAATSDLRMSLIQAGFRYHNGPTLFYGLKGLGAILLPLCYLLYYVLKFEVTTFSLVMSLAFGALGYYLPNYGLARTIRRRQDRIDRALPDVLDLLIVSLEAGLSLQSALNRVADEARRISKDLHWELQITNAELRTGIPRDAALKNLGERTGVQSVKSLVALMIQSEKMGASIAHSLRTHADFVRVQRAQRAEEMAAKMPIKIIFPTLFCIFPAIFIVILGPAAIKIYRGFLMK